MQICNYRELPGCQFVVTLGLHSVHSLHLHIFIFFGLTCWLQSLLHKSNQAVKISDGFRKNPAKFGVSSSYVVDALNKYTIESSCLAFHVRAVGGNVYTGF
ncbi:hypothetical protein SOMG_00454 [Schizosaccharomyces osmophilus]|uniref:Uncharacterized protein n=1 Tax=Schizosaccharomyces osmophilus TaxID=2545709 RepID=A0AAE9W8T0_9SCHI|nr:uncharacterized protein SOMG_00454 [Schizosaccharomyces osmophilus]WBW70932.1 hypothetical protein SOMG_00454 [Schizosaccharomyces osmophilus]